MFFDASHAKGYRINILESQAEHLQTSSVLELPEAETYTHRYKRMLLPGLYNIHISHIQILYCGNGRKPVHLFYLVVL